MIFDEMKDEVYQNLLGFTRAQEQVTHLTAPITEADLVVPIADAGQVNRGVIEIDDELIYVDRKDTTSSSATVPPYGRGYLGTTASTHDAGARVINNPRTPRDTIGKSLNQTIRSVFPDLYAVKTTEFPYVAARLHYELPRDANQLLTVEWQPSGPSLVWMPIRFWRSSVTAQVVDVEVGDAIEPGRPVRLTYGARPIELDDFSVEFCDTGLDDNARDVIVYGACSRIVGYQEAARLQSEAIESQTQAQLIPPGATLNAGKYFLQLHKQRLAEEQHRLQTRHPVVLHNTRF